VNGSIKIGVEAAGKVIVHARGNPATIIAVAVAAVVVGVGAAVAYRVYGTLDAEPRRRELR
jgi:hypothetical protein